MEDKAVNKKDLTVAGVPVYDDGDGEENEMSLKEMLTAMRLEFRMVGRKFDSFEKNLGATQENVADLSTKMETAATNQDKNRREARAAASSAKKDLEEVKTTQRNMETKKAESLHQLQLQILK